MTAVHRTFAAAAVAIGSTLGAVTLLVSIQRMAAAGLTRLDDVVATGVQVVGLGILLWYLATAVVALICLGARSVGAVWGAGERRLARSGAPLARRLLGVGAGVAMAAAAVVAPAAAASSPALELTDDLGWGATQDAEEPTDPAPVETQPAETQPVESEPAQQPPSPSSGGSSSGTRPGTTVPASAPTDADQQPSYVVVTGDTLWDIAADHLPASADAADIAASWPDWYERNRDVVGSDPDLIHPGQVLVAPDHHTEEGA